MNKCLILLNKHIFELLKTKFILLSHHKQPLVLLKITNIDTFTEIMI